MSQSALFAAEPRVLAEDAEGGIRYRPGIVDASTATRWFDAIRDQVGWRTERRPMYDRVVDVPRLVGGFTLDGSDPMPDALREATQVTREALGVAFTHVGLNYYRDGRDSVAPHGDRELRDTDDTLVALLTLGATRPFRLRPHGRSGGPTHDIAPGSGDVLVMGGACQRDWEHGVPKVRSAGPRVSVTWRWVRRPATDR